MFTFLNWRTKSPYQEEFVSGTLRAAIEVAFITRSFTEILEELCLFRRARMARSLSTLTETVT
jgi:hypothetical protein